MPVRATKRGAERTPLRRRLRRARLRCELRRPGGRPRAGRHPARASSCSTATRSASARPARARRPTEWLHEPRPRRLDPPDVRRPRRPHADQDVPLDAAVDVLDLRLPPSCAPCCARRRRRRVRDRQGRRPDRAFTPCTPTAATCTAPLVVDALGWRRVLLQRARARSSRPRPGSRAAWRSTPTAYRPTTSSCGSTRAYVRAGYSWSFPAGDELRVGVGSFDPRDHVKEPTVRLAGDLDVPAVRYQGNWIPHRMRAAVEDGVFFVGDSAGHCLPTTAEGIRTALYFGLACGRELRLVARRPPDPRAGAVSATPRSARSTAGRSTGCCACSAGSAGSTPTPP